MATLISIALCILIGIVLGWIAGELSAGGRHGIMGDWERENKWSLLLMAAIDESKRQGRNIYPPGAIKHLS